MITADRARELLDYSPETGLFTWKQSRRAGARAGDIAGGLFIKSGYARIFVDGRSYMAHRLAWLVTHGYWPDQIDHINGDRADNGLANLRECSAAENHQNRKTANNNKSGCPGVSWNVSRARWQVQIMVDGRRRFCGHFASVDVASMVYRYWKRRLHTFNPTVRAA